MSEPVTAPELEKRTHVYVMRPNEYEISGCPCGNTDPDWSEFTKHLWCDKCQRDFKPEHGGIFDGPIGVRACELMGISLSMYEIATGKIVTNKEYMAEAKELRDAAQRSGGER